MNEIEKLKEEHKAAMDTCTSIGAIVGPSDTMSLSEQVAAIVAENVAMKDINEWCKTDAFKNMYREFKTAEALGCQDVDCMHDAMLVAIMHAPGIPATDAVIADMRASQLEDAARTIQAQTWDECEGDGIVAAIDALEIMAQKMRSGKGAA